MHFTNVVGELLGPVRTSVFSSVLLARKLGSNGTEVVAEGRKMDELGQSSQFPVFYPGKQRTKNIPECPGRGCERTKGAKGLPGGRGYRTRGKWWAPGVDTRVFTPQGQSHMDSVSQGGEGRRPTLYSTEPQRATEFEDFVFLHSQCHKVIQAVLHTLRCCLGGPVGEKITTLNI